MRLIDSDGSDRLRVLVEDRFEGGAAIDGLPHAAAGSAHVDNLWIRGNGVNCLNAAAHFGGPDRSGRYGPECIRIDLDIRMTKDGEQKREERERDYGFTHTVFSQTSPDETVAHPTVLNS